MTPDPARLLASGITVSDILEAIRKTNLIDSPGLIENEHKLVLGLVSGYTVGAFIHVLLVVAIVLFLVRLISGRRV